MKEAEIKFIERYTKEGYLLVQIYLRNMQAVMDNRKIT